MGLIMCVKKRHKSKVISAGSTVDTLTMLCTIVKTITEKLGKEKGLTHDQALRFILECIAETDVTLDLDRLKYESK